MTDVLFVITNGAKRRWPNGSPLRQFSAGVGYLVAIMLENGFSCDLIDFDLDGVDVTTFVEEVERLQPRTIGFSSLTEGIDTAVELARIAKTIRPDTTTILGGPHGTFLGHELVAAGQFDVVVRGEAEGILPALLAALLWDRSALDRVPGLIFRRDGAIVSTPSGSVLSNLDALPFPHRAWFTSNQYAGRNGIISARGCPFTCVFCNAQVLSGRRYRMRTAESVFDEIVSLWDSGVRFFTFLDDLTTLNARRLFRVCALIRASELCDIHWGVESRVDTVTPELLAAMYSAGCRGIHFGVESGNDETLTLIRKRITRSQVERAVGQAAAAGLQVICSFIIGHPGEDKDATRATFAFAEELYQRHHATCLFSSLTPFPGTDLYQRAAEFGITIHAQSFSEFSLLEPIISTSHLSRRDLEDLVLEARELEARTSIVRERLRQRGKEPSFDGQHPSIRFSSTSAAVGGAGDRAADVARAGCD